MENTKYYQQVRRYVVSRIRNPADAEDITQTVFLEYYRNNNKGKNPEEPKAYLLGITKTVLANYYSQKNKQQKLLSVYPKYVDESFAEHSRNHAQSRELIEELEKIITKLPPKAREAIKLILIENLSYKQAARRAKCSMDVFYERFYEGIKILREKLKPQVL